MKNLLLFKTSTNNSELFSPLGLQHCKYVSMRQEIESCVVTSCSTWLESPLSYPAVQWWDHETGNRIVWCHSVIQMLSTNEEPVYLSHRHNAFKFSSNSQSEASIAIEALWLAVHSCNSQSEASYTIEGCLRIASYIRTKTVTSQIVSPCFAGQ